ncbi:MAG: 1,2-phenylacetyl-CoA epoxidase subunit B [Bacteroidetes bacterium]|nr:1,2-phenylacetyl-CoA epoxidase subunit B [Bacteroidota bacterium]
MSFTIFKLCYGDIPDQNAGAAETKQQAPVNEWPLWEVFIRSKQGLDHKHAGSLHAADAAMAIENARDVYTRRQEGVSIWVVESKYITASNPDEAGELYEPAVDKIYRHPTFYQLPDEVNHM